MITHHNGRAFEVLLDGAPSKPLYYAQVHCWCGSTLSSGEHVPTIAEALTIAAESLADHRSRGNHAGRLFRTPCITCGAHANVEPRDDGAMLCDRCNEDLP